jgi:hypothetical protein
MAIDTATKRASMLTFSSNHLLPIPSGAFDQGDRQTLLGLYSGILAGAAVLIVQAGTGIIKLIYLGVLEEGHSESR